MARKKEEEIHARNLVEAMNLFVRNRGVPTVPTQGDLGFWKEAAKIYTGDSLSHAKSLGVDFTKSERENVDSSHTLKALVETYDGLSTLTARSVSDVTAPLSLLDDTLPTNAKALQAVPLNPHDGQVVMRNSRYKVQPIFHPKWKLKKVVVGHTGWVRAIAVDPSNQWFSSGGNDRLIKIWNLATGQLRLTLTGHIHAVRDIKISERHPYLFSCGEDHTVKCWDLEQNKVVRHYHGHLSGVYSLSVHPNIDILATGGRDATVRIWDMRTRDQIHCLTGHTTTVFSVATQGVEPQVISGSADKTIRTWDLKQGTCRSILTHHSKTIRSICLHPRHYSFISASADAIKVWRGEEAAFERDFTRCRSIVNSLTVKDDPESAVIVAGCDNGMLHFYDFESGELFQTIDSTPVHGSLYSEAGINCAKFDKSETRLLTGESDKTIRIWEEESPEPV